MEKGDYSYYFEVHCHPGIGEKYDFSKLEYNNMIDGEIRDLKTNIPYPVMDIVEHIKKYDIDTDKIEEVTIIKLQTSTGFLRIVAPYALIDYWETISDKIDKTTSLTIMRKESPFVSRKENEIIIHVYVK